MGSDVNEAEVLQPCGCISRAALLSCNQEVAHEHGCEQDAKTPDRIEKQVLLRAPRAKVWRALSDSAEFGLWFGMKVEGPFVAGTTVRGAIVPTIVSEEVAKMQKPYEGKAFELQIVKVEPERIFSFRWHPYAVEPDVDFSKEPTTLIVFELHDAKAECCSPSPNRASIRFRSSGAPRLSKPMTAGGPSRWN